MDCINLPGKLDVGKFCCLCTEALADREEVGLRFVGSGPGPSASLTNTELRYSSKCPGSSSPSIVTNMHCVLLEITVRQNN